jgi:putative salt-induced outer membrane protein YdiY
MVWPSVASPRSLSRLVRTLACVASLWGLGANDARAAPKVDLVSIEKGDRLICEIKSLDRGRLTVSTDALDTVHVYWDRIDHVASPRVFEVELDDGRRYYGSLAGTVARRLVVGAPPAGVEVDMHEVIRITPLEASFFSRIDGHIDLGFSFNKADLETRWTVNAVADYRSRSYEGSVTLASQLSIRDNADELSRNTVSVAGRRLFSHRWFGVVVGQLQENQELSLDLRTVAGGGAGRYLVQSNSTSLQVFSGLVHTREQFTGTDMRNSPEVLVGTSWDWFSARNNDIDLTTTAVGYFNVGGDARTRVESQSALRFEFLKDFYFSVNGYSSYDSSPPEGRANSDGGVSLTLGWKF